MKRAIALEKIVDFLIINGAADTCAKCIYAKDAYKKNGDVDEDFCKRYQKDGNVACKNGMIKFYTKEM